MPSVHRLVRFVRCPVSGHAVRSFRIFWLRNFLRRPLFLLNLAVIGLIASGLFPGCGGKYAEQWSAADQRRLQAAGCVQAKELTRNGYRLILDHLSFSAGSDGAGEIARRSAERLNEVTLPKDRLQIFLPGEEASPGDISQSEETSVPEGTDLSEGGSMPEGTALSEGTSVKGGSGREEAELFRRIRIGDRVCFYGKCALPETASNPGQFDSRKYCLARRILLKMTGEKCCGISDSGTAGLRRMILGYRNLITDLRLGMQSGLLTVFDTEDAPQIAAFVLGDGSGLDDTLKQMFRDGGMSWLVCVSSLHISMLGMMIYRLLRSRGVPFALSGLPAGAAVISYALMTGFSVSSQRALVTFLIWMGAQVFGRTRDTLTSLSAASLVILVRQPYALWDSSYLMPCSCILSLEYLAPALERVFRPRGAVRKRICASVSLWAGSLPAVLWFYYQTTPYGSMLYPVLLPLMGILLLFGLAGSAAGFLYLTIGIKASGLAGRTIAWPCHILLKGFAAVCRLESALPGSVLILGRPAWWQMLLYYTVLAGFVIRIRTRKPGIREKELFPFRHITKAHLKTVSLLLLLAVMISLRRKPEFRYTCMDIGQGSCNLIEHKGFVILFDAGSSSVDEVWRYRIDSTLKYYGIGKVDLVLLSHGDIDHTNGIGQLLEGYRRNLAGQNAGDVTIGQILLPDLPQIDEHLSAIAESAAMKGIETGCVCEGASMTHGEMSLKILGPSAGRITGNANEDCIVMLLDLGDMRILFPGDLEKEGEELFVKAWKQNPVFTGGNENRDGNGYGDENENGYENGCGNGYGYGEGEGTGRRMILVAGHHGSKNATSEEWLDLVKPDLVLISCGKNNRYGHPAQAMLQRLENRHIPFRRTDLEGALQVISGHG